MEPRRSSASSPWLSQLLWTIAEVTCSARSDREWNLNPCPGRAVTAAASVAARGRRAGWPRRCSARWRSARGPYTPPTPTCPTPPPATASGTTEPLPHTRLYIPCSCQKLDISTFLTLQKSCRSLIMTFTEMLEFIFNFIADKKLLKASPLLPSVILALLSVQCVCKLKR